MTPLMGFSFFLPLVQLSKLQSDALPEPVLRCDTSGLLWFSEFCRESCF